MITKEQIEGAANKSFSRDRIAEKSGFVVGAEWAAEQMQAEVERLNILLIGSANEAGRLRDENYALRAAIRQAMKEARSEPDANDALFLVVETLNNAIKK